MTYELPITPSTGASAPMAVLTDAGSWASDGHRRIVLDKRDHIAMGQVILETLVATEFRKHKNRWVRDTRHLSSPIERYMHPSYQRVIGLGPAVIPLLLRDLENHLTDWFFALRAIAGANPVKPSMAGDVRRMASAWLRWGRERSLIR
jgi:hypothetical protein